MLSIYNTPCFSQPKAVPETVKNIRMNHSSLINEVSVVAMSKTISEHGLRMTHSQFNNRGALVF